MGFIAELAKASFPNTSDGREEWRRRFATAKEDKPHPGGSWGRSVVSTDASVKRLLQALRSQCRLGLEAQVHEV